jgi:hypothetical protein
LIKFYKGKFYVFGDINAESWGWDEETDKKTPNYLSIKSAYGVFDTKEEALKKIAKYEIHNQGIHEIMLKAALNDENLDQVYEKLKYWLNFL